MIQKYSRDIRVSRNDFDTDCPGARRRAYSVFNTDTILDHVGRYGNSDPTNISQWLRIINETFESSDEVTVHILKRNT